MIVVLFIVGYLFLGALTAAIVSYVDDEDVTKDDFFIVLIFLWPLYLLLMAIWGVAIALSKLAISIRDLIAKFIDWLRSDEK